MTQIVRPRYRMLDLYSGLGGASEAMVRAGWSVYRLENNPALTELERTYGVDVLTLEPQWLRDIGPVDLLWASPPCLEFSLAYMAPGPLAQREGRPFEPDLGLIEKAIQVRDEIDPRFWCFENVRGAIRHWEPLLGPPTQIIGPFVLWHNLPRIILPYEFEHLKKDNDTWSTEPLRANIKGKIPIEISEAVLAAVITPTLEEFQ